MTSFVSPGVYSVEQDLSQYVSDLSSTILGLVGTSEIGPTNTPVLITSPQEFKDIFGGVSTKHYMGYAANAYLKKGNLLWVNRVSPSDAAKASAAFILPESYANYAGDWVLSAQSSTDVTLTLSDSVGVTGANKVVKLGSNQVIPGFDWTDSSQTAVANGKIGADLASFIGSNDFIVGKTFSITVGAGRGTAAPILSLINVDGNGTPAVKLPLTSFPSSNSPATAFAVGSVVSNGAAVTGPITLGMTSGGKAIKIAFSGAKDTALLTALKATSYSDLESKLSTTSGDLTVTLPLVTSSPVSVSDASYNLQLIAAAISCLISAANASSSSLSSYTKLSAWAPLIQFALASGSYGIGSSTGSIKSVSTLLDASNNVIEVQLTSGVAGASGISSYPSTSGTGILTVAQSISGKFTTSAYRPTWKLEASGDLKVPTVIKISSLGEADSSNTAVVLSFVDTDLTSTQEQNYTLKVYERVSSPNISSSSYRLADFILVEQFTGPIDTIKSNVDSSSRRISMKIDYSTTAVVNMSTGAVTLAGDGLVHTPVLVTSETGSGVSSCYTHVLSTGSYDQTLTTALLGGTSGTAVTKDDIIGDPSERTGIYAFSNPEVIDINVLCAPGWSADPSVAKAMVSLAENRGDVIALVDAPFGLNVQNVVNYRKNILNLNSSYGAMYYPWVKIADTVNKKDIYVPPTSLVAAQYAYTDQVSDVFYAPAGRNRGTITEALAVERTLTQGQRDILALNQVNPIHAESGYGIYIKGQRTLQTTTTALDRVNVRRLLLKLRKVVASASKAFEFEPGDAITAQKLKQVAETVLEDHLRRGAINSYVVDVGPNVNTVLVRENNELRMNISLVPTKTAEIIIETYLIQNQGGGVNLA